MRPIFRRRHKHREHVRSGAATTTASSTTAGGRRILRGMPRRWCVAAKPTLSRWRYAERLGAARVTVLTQGFVACEVRARVSSWQAGAALAHTLRYALKLISTASTARKSPGAQALCQACTSSAAWTTHYGDAHACQAGGRDVGTCCRMLRGPQLQLVTARRVSGAVRLARAAAGKGICRSPGASCALHEPNTGREVHNTAAVVRACRRARRARAAGCRPLRSHTANVRADAHAA